MEPRSTARSPPASSTRSPNRRSRPTMRARSSTCRVLPAQPTTKRRRRPSWRRRTWRWPSSRTNRPPLPGRDRGAGAIALGAPAATADTSRSRPGRRTPRPRQRSKRRLKIPRPWTRHSPGPPQRSIQRSPPRSRRRARGGGGHDAGRDRDRARDRRGARTRGRGHGDRRIDRRPRAGRRRGRNRASDRVSRGRGASEEESDKGKPRRPAAKPVPLTPLEPDVDIDLVPPDDLAADGWAPDSGIDVLAPRALTDAAFGRTNGVHEPVPIGGGARRGAPGGRSRGARGRRGRDLRSRPPSSRCDRATRRDRRRRAARRDR